MLIAKEAELFRERIEAGGMFPHRANESEEVQLFQARLNLVYEAWETNLGPVPAYELACMDALCRLQTMWQQANARAREEVDSAPSGSRRVEKVRRVKQRGARGSRHDGSRETTRFVKFQKGLGKATDHAREVGHFALEVFDRSIDIVADRMRS